MRHCFLLTVESDEVDPAKVLALVNGRLGESLQVGMGNGMIGPAASEVGVSIDSITASQTVTIKDQYESKPGLEVGVDWYEHGIRFMPRGYGEYSVPAGEGSPVRLLLYEGTLLLEYCSDIEKDHVEFVPLDKAKDKVA